MSTQSGNSGPAPARGTLGGVLRLLAAYLSYAIADAAAKWLVEDLPVWEVLCIRGWLGIALGLLLRPRACLAALRSQPARSDLLAMNLANFAGWAAYYAAAIGLPLPQLYTIYYLSPIMTALLAGPMLGERLRPVNWIAAGLGFFGVVVSNLPGQGAWPPIGPALLGLLAAGMWALASVLYRRHVQGSSTLELMVGNNLTLGALSALVLPWTWQVPARAQWLLLCTVTVAGLAAHGLYISGIRRVRVAVAGPVSFFALIWSALLAWLIWGQLPGPALVGGSGLIVLAGLLLLADEWRRLRASPAEP